MSELKIPESQTVVPRKEPLVDAIVGSVKKIAHRIRCSLSGGVVDRLADEAHAAIAESEVSSAGMVAVKAFALDHVISRGRRIERLIAVPHQGKCAASRTRGRIPVAVHRWVPGEIKVSHLAQQDRIGGAVGDFGKPVLGVASQNAVSPQIILGNDVRLKTVRKRAAIPAVIGSSQSLWSSGQAGRRD